VAAIRPLQRADLPAVADLLRTYLPGWKEASDLEGFLAGTLLDDPWADEELPSLVATADGGGVVGFIGVQVRRLRFGDRELRGVCACNCVVSADQRGSAAGAFLLRRVMNGPQDLSWSDQASYEITRMWRAFGGEVDYARICDWMLVLRPARWLAGAARGFAGRRGIGREEIPVGALPFQAAGRRLLPRAHAAADPGVTGEDAGASEIAAAVPEITRGVSAHVAYDAAFLAHLFKQVEALRGPVVRRLVHRDGRPIGWYACVQDAPGITRVLNLSALGADADAVLAELIADSRARGTVVLSGRMEPHLLDPLRSRMAVLGFARQPTIHGRGPDMHGLLAHRPPLITQLDSEWFVTRSQVFSARGQAAAGG
jgi:hypothetical protein